MSNKIVPILKDGNITAPQIDDAISMADGDFRIGLGDAAGVKNFYIENNSGGVLFTVDSSGKVTTKHLIVADDEATPPLMLTARSAAPTGPSSGQIYLDDGTNTASGSPGFRRYTGTAWEDIGAVAGSGGGGSVGGVYGINVETLSADKTLIAGTDKIYQYLDSNSGYRTITLDTASATAGDRFVIRNTMTDDSFYYLQIYQSTNELERVYAGQTKSYIFDGTNWIPSDNATASNYIETQYSIGIGYNTKVNNKGASVGYNASGTNRGTSVGYSASGDTNGVAIGYHASGSHNGTAVGYSTYGYYEGVAVGYVADGCHNGVAVGYHASTNSNYYSVAFGYYSRATRYSEVTHNINGDSSQNSAEGTVGFYGVTANGTPTEIFAGGVSNKRFIIKSNSVVTFSALITAVDVDNGDGCGYKIEGVIKNYGGTTSLVGTTTQTVLGEDDVAMDVVMEADDVNDALIMKVTGNLINSVRWTGSVRYSEVSF